EGLGLDGILLHSGSENYYFADDNHVPFRPVPNFAHWVPLDGPNHFLLFRPGAQLRLVRNVPRDFWYETPTDLADYWQSSFEIVEVDGVKKALAALSGLGRLAYIGDNPGLASELGIAPELIQPRALLTRLDYARSVKTPYEVECIRRASERAARGHRAALAGFQTGLSEREIHRDYLNAIGGAER